MGLCLPRQGLGFQQDPAPFLFGKAPACYRESLNGLGWRGPLGYLVSLTADPNAEEGQASEAQGQWGPQVQAQQGSPQPVPAWQE